MYYRATQWLARDRQGREYRRTLAAGSLAHCAAACREAGDTIEDGDRRPLASLYGDVARITVTQLSSDAAGDAAWRALSAR